MTKCTILRKQNEVYFSSLQETGIGKVTYVWRGSRPNHFIHFNGVVAVHREDIIVE